jgi:hypothetical protein
MKSKKARKRLRLVEGLLTKVIEKYKRQSNVVELLGTAKTAVSGALTKLPKASKKPPARAAKSAQKAAAATSSGAKAS